MGLLKPSENLQGYLKAGILGFAGTGKTYTAALLALGLVKYHKMEGREAVAFMDTENGADYVKPKFDAAGIPLLVHKGRAFADVLKIVPEAEKSCCVLIVDSVTHIWRELCDSYQKRRNIRRLQFQHWADLKSEWQVWSDLYLNSSIHIIVCGRAGWIYDLQEDSEGGKDLVKTGTKMKVEGEFGFEPSLLIEMERVLKVAGTVGSGWIHRAHILKDRTDNIDGKMFDDPTLDPFFPVLKSLNIGGEQLAVDTERTSEDMFEDPSRSRSEDKRRRTILLEEIEEACKVMWPSSSGADKKAKVKVIERLFGTKSWSKVQGTPLHDLEVAKGLLIRFEKEAGDEALGDVDATLAFLDRIIEEEAAKTAAEWELPGESEEPEKGAEASEPKEEAQELPGGPVGDDEVPQ